MAYDKKMRLEYGAQPIHVGRTPPPIDATPDGLGAPPQKESPHEEIARFGRPLAQPTVRTA